MTCTKLIAVMLSAVLCLTLAACGESEKVKAEKATAVAATAKSAADQVRAAEIAKIGVDAVVYGLPIVIAELTKRVQTNVAAPQLCQGRPRGQALGPDAS